MIKKCVYRFAVLAAAVLLWLPAVKAEAASRLQDTGDKLVIVIDPGHGGDNRGTIENNHEEKFMTMTTALAMYEELQRYDNVEVYLTRTEDVKLSLKERAEFAVSVDADFMFSIHYNASANHELYGSEVWVSSVAPYNGYGLQFGHEFLSEAREMGLLVRGVKTRLGDEGDYYGIIRESVALNLPALIIEHCHVDNINDTDFCDTDEDLKAFGIADATTVAKYFGLSSSELNVDYSGYSLTEASATSLNSITKNDDTEPDVCQISLKQEDYEAETVTLEVTAADYDSPLMYYSYSLDGGKVFSERETWPGCDALAGTYTDTFTLDLKVPANVTAEIILRAYNSYDLYTESNLLTRPKVVTDEKENASQGGQDAADFSKEPPASSETKELPGTTTFRPAMSENAEEQEVSFLSFLKLCLVFVAVLFVIVFVSQLFSYRKHKKRRRQCKNEFGNSKNQVK
ncbi:MAG: N-acetylmuramoyl-L-alanine amidase [Lachnospiraceae bacterium]|nr:N-acetylmuramoyl-L-alanine amidase [Lachnospiraceae bacterium]